MNNFRDLSKFNLKIKKGLVYRASVFDLLKNNELLKEKSIKSIIDLRADREIEEISYSDQILNQVKYVKSTV